MATLIALGRVFVCALFSSKQSCESAGSLGKVNLAVADGSELITAEELRGASKGGESGSVFSFLEAVFSSWHGRLSDQTWRGCVACLDDSDSVGGGVVCLS